MRWLVRRELTQRKVALQKEILKKFADHDKMRQREVQAQRTAVCKATVPTPPTQTWRWSTRDPTRDFFCILTVRRCRHVGGVGAMPPAFCSAAPPPCAERGHVR